MLDFMLRYLRSKVNQFDLLFIWNRKNKQIFLKDKKEWLGKENEPLKGFDWRGGAGRHTTGMIMWSEPLLMTTAGGEEVRFFFYCSNDEKC